MNSVNTPSSLSTRMLPPCCSEDVRELAVDVLAHRVLLDPRTGHARGGEETTWIVREVLEQVPVPL